jgi:hypothetical protein
MMRRNWLVLILLLVGCGPSAQEEYDAALRLVDRQQERLDALRPAYDGARQAAVLAVSKEFGGGSPEESATAALQQLEGVLSQAASTPAPAAPTRKDPFSAVDAAINNLTAAQEALKQQQATLSGSIDKANEVLKNIDTPGTAEAKRLEELLAGKPEVQAYRRQEERLEKAKQAANAAEAKLGSAAAK